MRMRTWNFFFLTSVLLPNVDERIRTDDLSRDRSDENALTARATPTGNR